MVRHMDAMIKEEPEFLAEYIDAGTWKESWIQQRNKGEDITDFINDANDLLKNLDADGEPLFINDLKK